MTRVLIAELQQETSTFNPHPTQYEDFLVVRGAAILAELQGTNTEIAGALDVFAEHGDVEACTDICGLGRTARAGS